MTIEQMIERKRELGYTNEQISELSGVPLGTVQKIFGGATKAPRFETVKALEKVLAEPKSSVSYLDIRPSAGVLNEAAPKYGAGWQGEYTVDDYYALPDERRVELIDGIFYDMAAPSVGHQTIQLQLAIQINNCIDKHKCDCNVVISPVDVQLDQDDKTMVQPDVIIFCGMENVRRRKYYGAPDFVAEIISPSSRKRDMFIKLSKYARAGVKEYWVIDPKYKTVLVYAFDDDLIEKYTFEDKIPIAISKGKCEIDFAAINRAAEKFYDIEE